MEREGVLVFLVALTLFALFIREIVMSAVDDLAAADAALVSSIDALAARIAALPPPAIEDPRIASVAADLGVQKARLDGLLAAPPAP